MFDSYKNQNDPNCLCKFKMWGTMTEQPEEATEHNPKCPVHKVTIKEVCSCKKIVYECKDAFENKIEYRVTDKASCDLHSNDPEDEKKWNSYTYIDTPWMNSWSGNVDRRRKEIKNE